MAGPESAADAVGWRKWEQRGQISVADPAQGTHTTGVQVPIAGTDPYFVWSALNAGRRVAMLRPSKPASRAAKAAAQNPWVVACTPKKYTPPNAFLQVLIQVATGKDEDASEDQGRRESLNKHIQDSKSGLRLRGVFKDSAVGAQNRARHRSKHRALRADTQFVSGIVADWWLGCFLERIGSECVRWEMAHARSPIDVKPPPLGPAFALALEHAFAADDDAATWNQDDKLLGGKVMVIIDYGCPFAHPAFKSTDGAGSRVRYVWFQGYDAISADLPRPFRHRSGARLFPYGKELRGSIIDTLMASHTEAGCYEALGYDLMREASSHGGHVMSIACGGPNPLARQAGEDWLCGFGSGPQTSADENDDASAAKIIFIELPRQTVGDTSGGAMNVHLMDALYYVLERTTDSADITVNCSFGSHGGPHDNSSLMEQALEDVLARRPKGSFKLVVPMGNAFNSACHAFAAVTKDQPLRAAIDVPADKSTDTFVEVWFPRSVSEGDRSLDQRLDEFSIELTAPTGQVLRPSPGDTAACWFAPMSGDSPSVTVVQTAAATATRHRMLVVIAPTWQKPSQADQGLAPYGHWQIAVRRKSSGTGVPVDIWIERDDAIFEPPVDRQSRFVTGKQVDAAEDFGTGPVSKASSNTSYGSGPMVLVAGAYVRPTRRDDQFTRAGTRPVLAAYSSAGPSQPHLAQNKPDALAAVDDSAVLWGRNAAANLGRGWVRRNGTSVAAPQLARHLLNGGTLNGLSSFAPSLAGARGDGLSTAGAALQAYRVGRARALFW